jgi:hypothetical protein
VRRLVFTRWARALAIVGGYVLALQSMGLPRFATGASAASCCCHARGEACHCPVCSHQRAQESGQPLLQSCPSGPLDLAVVTLDPSLPPPALEPLARVAAQKPPSLTYETPEDPPQEVPTPPPLG